MMKAPRIRLLWLDVEKGRDTTGKSIVEPKRKLWLDVEKGRDTTVPSCA